MLHFNAETGLYADTASTVRESVRQEWTKAFAETGKDDLDTSAHTPAGQLVDSQTAAIARKDAELLYLANQFNPYVNDGKWQDSLGKIYFLQRKIAEPTLVECECRGLAGTEIPGWSLIKTLEGKTLVSTAPAVIPENGVARVMFRASETGPVIVPAGSACQIVTTVPGWDTVVNPTAGVTGRDEESRSDFEARRRKSVAANAHGSAAAIYGTVANIPGVLHCKVLENTGSDPVVQWGVTIGGHSVLASVYGGEDAAVAEAIYRKKDAGCGTSGNHEVTHVAVEENGAVYQYRVERPEPTPFGVRVELRRARGTCATIEEDIKRAVLANFNGEPLTGAESGTVDKTPDPRVSMAETVYASRFITAIVNAGVQDILSVKVAYPASEGQWGDEVDINADTVPVLSENDIIVDIKE